jgi:hypothetical protein
LHPLVACRLARSLTRPACLPLSRCDRNFGHRLQARGTRSFTCLRPLLSTKAISATIGAATTPAGGRNAAGPENQYVRVAIISEGRVARRPLHPLPGIEAVNAAIERLEPAVANCRLPFAAIDTCAYWLLDAVEHKPLALLHSCTDAEAMTESPARPVWVAMPVAQLEIEDTQTPGQRYVPPVNYRLQKLVEERAGRYPRAAWFDRKRCPPVNIPARLISETRDRDEHH